MRKRVHRVKFRLDDDELMLLRRKLRESNLSMAEYFRRLLVYGEIKIYPNAFVADLQNRSKALVVMLIRSRATHFWQGIARNFASNFRSAGEDRAAA